MGTEMFCILIWAWITWVYTFVKTHPTIYLISVYFTMHNRTLIINNNQSCKHKNAKQITIINSRVRSKRFEFKSSKKTV